MATVSPVSTAASRFGSADSSATGDASNQRKDRPRRTRTETVGRCGNVIGRISYALPMCPDVPATSHPRERVRVFISAKSSDYEYADRVYRRLGDAGVTAFFSRESLPELGSADYRKEIDRALDEAEHMIVITSSVDHVLAPWVEAEWGFFINEKRSGRKRGNLVTLVVGALTAANLPPSLRYYEVIPFEPDSIDKLLRYVMQPSADSSSPPAGGSFDRRRGVFHEVATFGGPPGVRLMKVPAGQDIVATGGFDGAVRVYDTTTRVRRAVFGSSRYWMAKHEGLITALEFRPDGRRLASGHLDGTIHLWDLDTQREMDAPLKHDLAISGLVFSVDGRTLTTASKDGVIKFWDCAALDEGRASHAVHRQPAPVASLACVRGNGWLVIGLINTASRRYVVQIQEGDIAHTVLATISVPESFTIVTLSDDGCILAAGGRDGTVRLYDFDAVAQALAQQKIPKAFPPLADLHAHKKPITSVSFLPDARRVVTCAMDNNVIIWDLQSGKPSIRLQGGASEQFVGAAVVGNGTTLVAALADGRLRLWEEA
jgi:hypothetical protein